MEENKVENTEQLPENEEMESTAEQAAEEVKEDKEPAKKKKADKVGPLKEEIEALKKELEERIIFYVKDEDIPEELIVCEHNEPNFRRFRGGLRTFVDDNKVALEILDVNGNPQA